MDLTTRVNLVRSLHSTTEKPEIPVSVAADLCGINRSSIYYSGKSVSDTELECKEIIDHLHTDHPTWGPGRWLPAETAWLSHRTEEGKTVDDRNGH